MSRAVVMEGSLEEFDLTHVMQTVCVGRQSTGIELLDECGSLVGTLFLKAGQVISARSDNGMSGLAAVQRLIRTRRSRRFCVYRSVISDEPVRPVGALTEVLMRIAESEAKACEDLTLMEGGLGDHALTTLLEVLSLGRQCLGIDLFNAEGRQAGALCVKGGKVLFALCGRTTGTTALMALLAAEHGRFVVYQTRLCLDAEPLGSVRAFVSDARAARQRDAIQATAELDADEVTETSSTLVRRPMPSRPPLAFPGPEQATRSTCADGTRSLSSSAAFPARHAASVLPGPARPPSLRPSSVPRATWSSAPPEGRLERRASRRPPLVVPALGTPVLCVTSPRSGAGKTTVSLHLSMALARRGFAVTLVDADANGLRRVVNGPRDAPGLTDVLEGESSLDDVSLATSIPGLCWIATGLSELAPHHELGLSDVLGALRERVDMVLVDCPPSVYGVTQAVARAATHALLIVNADPACPSEGHENALRALGANVAVAGIVLNMLDYQTRASLRVLEELCTSPHGPWVMEAPIPHCAALLDHADSPLHLAPLSSTASNFELLASLLLERLGKSAVGSA